MKTIQTLLFLGLLPIALLAEKIAPLPEGIPAGYKLVHSQDFEGNEAKEKSRLWFTTPDNWNVPAVRGKSFIEFKTNPIKDKDKVRSPLTIGVLRDVEVKDFLEEFVVDSQYLPISIHLRRPHRPLHMFPMKSLYHCSCHY